MPEGVQFDEEEDKFLYTRVESSSRTPKLVQWVADKGWVKDTNQAMHILLGVIVVALIVAVAAPFVLGRNSSRELPPGTQVIDLPGEPIRLAEPIYDF